MDRALVLGAFFSLTSIAAHATPVPVEVVPGGAGSGQIFVSCRMDGHDDRCQLDTGGGRQFIKYDDFSRGYPSLGKVTFKSATGVPRECDLVRIARLEFASEVQSDVDFIRCDQAPNDFSTMGINLLDRRPFNLDLKANTLDSDARLPKGVPTHRLQRFENGLFAIGARIAGRHLHALFDTGAGLTVAAGAFVARRQEHFTFLQDIPGGMDGTGKPIVFKLYQVDRVKIAGLESEDSYLLSMDLGYLESVFPGVDGIIGFNHIVGRNWYFDLVKGRWAAE